MTDRSLLLVYSSQGYVHLLPELLELPVDRCDTTVPSSETNLSVATDGHDRDQWPWSYFCRVKCSRASIYPHNGGLFYEVHLATSIASF